MRVFTKLKAMGLIKQKWLYGLVAGCLGLMLPLLGWAEGDIVPNGISAADIKALVAEGELQRNAGNLMFAQQKFDLALLAIAQNPGLEVNVIAAAETAAGYNLFLLNKKTDAEKLLTSVYQKTADQPYLHALAGQYLGTLALAEGETEEAATYIDEALKSLKSSSNPGLVISLELMRFSLNALPAQEAVDKLLNIANRLAELPNDAIKTRLQFALGQNILDLDVKSTKLLRLAELRQQGYDALMVALHAIEGISGQERMRAEILASLGHLYRQEGKYDDALVLVNRSVESANLVNAKELLAKLEAEKGDLLRMLGNNSDAITAYEHAVSYLSAISADMPISLPDGRSSINAVTDPIHRNYVDLLLKTSEDQGPEIVQAATIKAVENMEIIKEADMQDFFLGRCAINTGKTGNWKTYPLGDAAIIYPIVLADRLELVIKTSAGLFRHKVPVKENEIKTQVLHFSIALQDGKDTRGAAKKLYEWMYLPIKDELQSHDIKTLIYVPDRDMRSVPFAAFASNRHYVIEDFSVVTMPSLAFQNLSEVLVDNPSSQKLFAGMSLADGPSLDKLPKKILAEIANAGKQGSDPNQIISTQRSILSESLSLPSVEKEIEILANKENSKVLLNKEFTAASFKSSLESGLYDKVHIASHGFFGNNARDSFIMTYDEIYSLEDFQTSLGSEKLKHKPLDLLTLSACETAQGNDRMLLGFSGMAIKSNVQSALGSLWPIDDEGAMEFMTLFYGGLNHGLAKAQALQEAQVAMLKTAKFKHPYYWSPFILTGNWH